MGMITGYFSLLCSCLLLAKALTRKFHLSKADKLLMRLHKYVSAVFLVVCILHIVFVSSVLQAHHMLVPLIGSLAAVVSVLIIILCHVIKEKKLNLSLHRVLSLLLLCCVIGHILAYFILFSN